MYLNNTLAQDGCNYMGVIAGKGSETEEVKHPLTLMTFTFSSSGKCKEPQPIPQSHCANLWDSSAPSNLW